MFWGFWSRNKTEKVIVKVMTNLPKIKKFLDVNNDGKVDFGDAWEFYQKAKELTLNADKLIVGFLELDDAGKQAAVVSLLKKYYPNARDCMLNAFVTLVWFIWQVYKVA